MRCPDIPTGWILVEEDIWKDLPDNGWRHLQDAYEAYLIAGRHVPPPSFEKQSSTSTCGGPSRGEDKTTLMDSIHDLQNLFVSDDPNRVNLTIPFRQYEHNMAKAPYAMARHPALAKPLLTCLVNPCIFPPTVILCIR